MKITNEQLMQALTQPSRSIGRQWMAGANRPGVHMFRGRARILTFIDPDNGISMADLIEKLDMRPSTATETINRLVAAGLVERRTEEADRRAVRIHLTEEGKKVATGASSEANATLEEMFSVLSEAEREQLYALLEKLNAHLATLEPEDPRGRRGFGPWGKAQPGMGFDPRGGFDPRSGFDPRGGFGPRPGFDPRGGFDPRSGFGPMGYGPGFGQGDGGPDGGHRHGNDDHRGHGERVWSDDRRGHRDDRHRGDDRGNGDFPGQGDPRGNGDFPGQGAPRGNGDFPGQGGPRSSGDSDAGHPERKPDGDA